MSDAPFTYSAHGIGIHSPVPLTLPPDPGAHADLLIQFSADSPPEHASPGEMIIRYQPGGTYVIRGGREVTAHQRLPMDDVTAEFLAGPAIAVALAQRGKAVLHASCVQVGNRQVAIAGASGAGKSTLAAALIRRGHTLVADDFVAMDAMGRVNAGTPRVRLWPDAAQILGYDTATAAASTDDAGKLEIAVDATVGSSEAPLLFILADGAEHHIEPITGPDILYHLLSNAYCIALLGSDDLPGEFARWAPLAAMLSCYRFERPRDLSRVAADAAFLEAFVQTC